MSMTAGVRTAARRVLCAFAVLSTLFIAGCGERAYEPTVTRTDHQADVLRERLRRGQGAT